MCRGVCARVLYLGHKAMRSHAYLLLLVDAMFAGTEVVTLATARICRWCLDRRRGARRGGSEALVDASPPIARRSLAGVSCMLQ